MAESLVKPYNMSIANRLMGPLAQTNHFLVTISSLTPEVESYLQNYTNASDLRRFLSERSGNSCGGTHSDCVNFINPKLFSTFPVPFTLFISFFNPI